MREDPRCHWCKRELTLYPSYGRGGFKMMPEDYPTIDHLTSAFMGPRRNDDGKSQTLVIACPQCNNTRNVAECQHHIWRTRWKSASFPFPLRWLGRLLKKYRYYFQRKNKKRRPTFVCYNRHMESPVNARYYYSEGMLYRVSGGRIYAMIEGKGWMVNWTPSEGAINGKTQISEDEARKVTERLGEDF